MKCIQKVIQEPNTGRSFRSSHETGKDRATLKPAFCTIGTVREPLGDRGYLAVGHPETLLFTSKYLGFLDLHPPKNGIYRN